MKMKKSVYFILFFLLCSLLGNAQKFEYKVQFEGIGDNREFTEEYNYPQTILGERTSFEVGTTIDSLHRFRIGVTHFFESGTDIDYNKPQITVYYTYNDEQTSFYFGAFPRKELVNFPLAMITDTINYYRPNIEGLYGQHRWKWGNQGGFVDWTSKQGFSQRETFMAGIFGKFHFSNFFIEDYFLLYHYALTSNDELDEHITDNMSYAAYLGYDFAPLTGLQKAWLKLGVLGSGIQDRGTDNGYIRGNSFSGQLYGEGKRFALRSTFSFGDNHQIMTGDPYYAQDSYVRTDVIWKFLQHKNIQGHFNLSFHVVDGTVDQQQQLSLLYSFGNSK